MPEDGLDLSKQSSVQSIPILLIIQSVALAVGDGDTGQTTQIARWRKSFQIFPAEAIRAQLILTNEQDGGYFSLNSFSITAQQFPNSFSPSL